MTTTTTGTVTVPTAVPVSDPVNWDALDAKASIATDLDQFAQADVVSSRLLVDKAELVGKRLGITHVRFQASTKGGNTTRNYVSVEGVDIAAGTEIVFNDGSTGVRRQLVQYLIGKGMLPQQDPDADVPVTEDNAAGYTITLYAPRGLRASTYTTADGTEATTYYLA